MTASLPSPRLRSFWLLRLGLALLFTTVGLAQNPLNLTPGVAANKTLGSLANPAAFNLTAFSGEITYDNADLATRSYLVRLPAGFDPTHPTRKYGLITSIESGSPPSLPAAYAATLDEYNLIWIAGHGIGNSTFTDIRRGVALMGVFRLLELYPSIDRQNIFVSGSSGGARTSNMLLYQRSDVFRAALPRIGASIPDLIPDWTVGDQTAGTADNGYEYGGSGTLALAPHLRTTFFTAATDFRRAEITGVYRYGHLNLGNTTQLIFGSGGHADPGADNFREMVDFLYHPLHEVIRDGFGDGQIQANSTPGVARAGSGFQLTHGSATETTLSLNNQTHGVLQLESGAALQSPDAFSWRTRFGTFLEARLRASSATATNQLVGLHLVAVHGQPGLPGDRPGLHLLRGYGTPSRLELVGPTGTRRTLATWNFSGTAPLSLPANDKAFWNNPTDAGFRGEFVRLFVSATGFQITFHRPITDFTTSYAVTVITTDSATATPNDAYPIALQGSWAGIEFDLFNSLGDQDFQLALSNQPVDGLLPAGPALFDEVRVVATSGTLARPSLSTTLGSPTTTHSLTWSALSGAFGTLVETAPHPDGPFTELTRTALGVATHTRTNAPGGTYYRVAALSASGTPGSFSLPVFAGTGTAPAAPTTPSATFPSATTVRLAWTDAASNESGYRVERSLAGRHQWQTLAPQLPANTANYEDSTAVPGVPYDYRLTAFGSTGLSTVTLVSATLPGNRAAQPTPAAFAASLSSQGNVQLTWAATPLDAHSFRLERSPAGTGTWSALAEFLAPTRTTFQDTTVLPGQAYDYRLRAQGPGGDSAYATTSLEVPASTWVVRNIGNASLFPGSAATLPPADPFTLDGRAGTSGTGTTAGGTFFERNDNLTFAFRAWTGDLIFTTRLQSFTATDGNARAGLSVREALAPGGRYGATTVKQNGNGQALFRVVANSSTMNSTYFATTEVARGFPEWLRLVRQGNVLRSYFSSDGLTWTQDGPDRTLSNLAATLSVGLVSSPGRGGNTATAVFTATSLLGLPAAPTGLTATSVLDPASIQLAWTPVPGADHYQVRRSTSSGGSVTVLAANHAATSFTDTTAPLGVPVFYTITATNLLGTGPASSELTTLLATPLESWRHTHFGQTAATGDAADLADPDGDGVSNLLEYALGTVPTSASSVSVPTASTSQLKLQLTFHRARSDITYHVEASSTLAPGSWTVLATNPGTVGQSVTVTDTIDLPAANPPRRFLRLRVTSP